MTKRFCQLKRGALFHSGDGWVLIKVGWCYGMAAYADFVTKCYYSPLEYVRTYRPPEWSGRVKNPHAVRRVGARAASTIGRLIGWAA